MDSFITLSHCFGLIPPEVNTPSKRTFAPKDLALFIFSTIGISFFIIETSDIFFLQILNLLHKQYHYQGI